MAAKRGKRRGGDARLRVAHGGESPRRKRRLVEPGGQLVPVIRDIRQRLRGDSPWDLLAHLSSVVAVAHDLVLDEDTPPLGINEIIESMIGVDLAETTAALHCFQALVQDDGARIDVREELLHRRQPLPLWLRGLDETQVTRAARVSDALNDGEGIILDVHWSGGGTGTYLLHIDHNLGGILADARPSDESLVEVVARIKGLWEDEDDGAVEDLPLGEARAVLEVAIARGDALDVDLDTGTWPAGRPLVEWLLALMPDDGVAAAEPVCGAGYADPCVADPSLGPGPATAIWGRELSPSTGQPISTVWTRLGVTCLPSAIPSGVRLPVGMVVNAFHRTPWAKATISTQPTGNVTLVNLKTFYRANWQPTGFQPGEVQSIPPAQMLGFPVDVRPKLVNYVYHYGDDESSDPTASPGGVYPDGDITHTYRQRGAFAARVEVTFGADYRVNGGGWQPLPGQATVTMPGTTVTVREARAVLVNE